MSQAILIAPISGVLDQAATARARLANSKLLLFKSDFIPSFSTTLAEVLAHQADFDGYPAGGATLVQWSAPILIPGAGAGISSPEVQFVFNGGGSGQQNLIGGYAVVTADNVLYYVGTFPEPYPFQVPGQGTPLTLLIGVGS